jgi:hypothetical protein
MGVAVVLTKARLAQYQQALSNWKLNAEVLPSLGLPVPPAPVPPFTVVVNIGADGAVAQPETKDGTDMVCPPYVAPVAPPPLTTVTLGAPMDNAGLLFAAVQGDAQPDGFVLKIPAGSTPSGTFVKHVQATPFGVEQWYSRVS